MPLSQFFLQLSGDGEDESDLDKRTIRGYRVKRDGEDDPNGPLGKIHFDPSEKSATKGTKGPRPKTKPRKPIPKPKSKPDEGEEEEEFEEAFAGPIRMGASQTTIGAMGSGNVAVAARPIGRPLRRLTPKARKRWVEGLAKLMGT